MMRTQKVPFRIRKEDLQASHMTFVILDEVGVRGKKVPETM